MLGLILVTLLGLAGSSLHFIVGRRPGLIKGWEQNTGARTITLTSFDSLQVVTTIFSILLKYVPGTIGYKTRLIPDVEGKGFNLPTLTLNGSISILETDVEKFNRAVSQQSKPSSNSLTNPFLLVSFTTPLLLIVLSDHACPIRPLGAVNTQNRFEFEDPTFCRDSRAILSASQSGSLSYKCSFGGSDRPGRRHKRGVEFEITIEVKNREQIVLRQHLSFLQFLPRYQAPKFIEEPNSKVDVIDTEVKEGLSQVFESSLRMQSSDTLRWAASCGDYNPIHVSVLAAKLFGFKSVIAHGNHGVTLAIQELLSSIQNSEAEDTNTSKHKVASLFWTQSGRFELQVKFAKPMVLPADLKVRWHEEKKGAGLEIVAKGKTCVIGQVAR